MVSNRHRILIKFTSRTNSVCDHERKINIFITSRAVDIMTVYNRKSLRDAQKLNTVSYTNDLHEALLAKDGPTFWRCWRSKFNSRLDCKQVGGCVDPELIANNFAQYFSEIYTPNSALHHYIMNIYHYVKITLVSHYQPTVFLTQNLSVRLFPTSNVGKPLIQLDLLLST